MLMLLVLASSMFIHHDMTTHETLIFIYPACIAGFFTVFKSNFLPLFACRIKLDIPVKRVMHIKIIFRTEIFFFRFKKCSRNMIEFAV